MNDQRMDTIVDAVRMLGGGVVASDIYRRLCADPAWRHTYGAVSVDLARLAKAGRLAFREVPGDAYGRNRFAFSACAGKVLDRDAARCGASLMSWSAAAVHGAVGN